MGARDELRLIEGTPGIHRNDLEELTAWLAESQEDDDGLLALISATEVVALHPHDADRLAAVVVQVQNSQTDEARDAAWTNVTALVASILARYDHTYPDDLGTRIRAARKKWLEALGASRGPPLYAANGAFRRGDLVVRPVARNGEIVGVQDAIYIDPEPVSDHTRAYGRMAAVHVVSRDLVDRWFLDQLFLGIDFGRPF